MKRIISKGHAFVHEIELEILQIVQAEEVVYTVWCVVPSNNTKLNKSRIEAKCVSELEMTNTKTGEKIQPPKLSQAGRLGSIPKVMCQTQRLQLKQTRNDVN